MAPKCPKCNTDVVAPLTWQIATPAGQMTVIYCSNARCNSTLGIVKN
jgi:hypothetical protein